MGEILQRQSQVEPDVEDGRKCIEHGRLRAWFHTLPVGSHFTVTAFSAKKTTPAAYRGKKTSADAAVYSGNAGQCFHFPAVDFYYTAVAADEPDRFPGPLPLPGAKPVPLDVLLQTPPNFVPKPRPQKQPAGTQVAAAVVERPVIYPPSRPIGLPRKEYENLWFHLAVSGEFRLRWFKRTEYVDKESKFHRALHHWSGRKVSDTHASFTELPGTEFEFPSRDPDIVVVSFDVRPTIKPSKYKPAKRGGRGNKEGGADCEALNVRQLPQHDDP
jgi:hypothetical protein